MPEPLLQIQNLNIAFETSRGLVQPVRDSNLTIYPGQTVALVGESGCGKSVTAMSILRLLPSPPARYLSGKILFRGENLLDYTEAQMRRVRGGQIAMIFQEPMTSLNPVYTIGDQIIEAITLHQKVNTRQARAIALESLREVGIADPQRRIDDYPHQMSGGMRQRVMIAMALACKPSLLIADEPTTALDVTIQAQILELLRKLQQDTGMSILMITHDLGVVAENADVVSVMYASRIVETATVEQIFDNPTHPYTRGLLESIPTLGERSHRLQTIPGNVPNPANFPGGCKFHTRCPLTRELAAKASLEERVTVKTVDETFEALKPCAAIEPMLHEIIPQHWVACHRVDGYASGKQTVPQLQHKREVVPQTIDVGQDVPMAQEAGE